MLDGLEFVADAKLSRKELEEEFCKPYGTPGKYLETDRLYRCEDDIFEDMDEEERDRLFGKPSYTVFDSMQVLKNDPKVETLLCRGDVFSELVLKSYAMAMLERWEMELIEKIIPANLSSIRRVSKIYSETVTTYDEKLWDKINDIKRELGKDTEDTLCVFSQIKKSITDGDFSKTSENQIKMNKLMKDLAVLYKTYNDNQIV